MDSWEVPSVAYINIYMTSRYPEQKADMQIFFFQ